MTKLQNIFRTIVIFLLLLSLVPAELSSAPDTKTFDTFSVIYFDETQYVSLIDLGETYRMPLAYDPLRAAMTIGGKNANITVMYGSPTVLVKGTRVSMVYPAAMIRGAIYVPASTFVPLLSSIVPAEFVWNVKRKGIETTGFTTTIRQVSCENFSNGSRVAIDMSESLTYHVNKREDGWITIAFDDGSYIPETLFTNAVSSLVADMRANQREGYAEIALLPSESCGDYTVSTANEGKRLLLSFRKNQSVASTTETVPVNSPAEEPVVSPPEPVPVEPDADVRIWRIDTVVIDAGHGGMDPGAIGPRNTQEKDVVLNVALELKKLIESRGEIKAVLTRETDVFVPLHRRAKMARDVNGKLFISIHANASKNRNVRGIEIYFLSAAKTQDAEDVARRENKAIELEENLTYYADFLHLANLPKDIRDIQIDMESSVYLKESQDLCRLVIDHACESTKLERRGVKQAGFLVMSGTQAFMPSVLFEIGFISNPEEEKLLARASYQKKLAESIYDAIIQFKQRHERGLFSGG